MRNYYVGARLSISVQLIRTGYPSMKIRVGYEMIYDFPQPTPMIMVLGTHFTRASDIIVPDYLTTALGADHALSRQLRQLVQPDRRARRADAACRPTASCATAACPMWSFPRACSMRSRICRRRRWSTCSAAATARPTGCPTSPGSCSKARRRAGRGCRRSAISSTATSPSATSMPVPPRRRGRRSTSARASAATTPTWPSRSAAA